MILVKRFTIGSFFRHKDTLNKDMHSAVVYEHVCPRVWGSVYMLGQPLGAKLLVRVWELESPYRSRLSLIYGTISSLVVDHKYIIP